MSAFVRLKKDCLAREGFGVDEPLKGVHIQVAGNTGLPCLLALRAKGYRVWLEYYRIVDTEFPNTGNHSTSKYHRAEDADLARRIQESLRKRSTTRYLAEGGGGYFNAGTPEELLGLVAMWEARGDDWRLKPGEEAIDDELDATARTFTFDSDGNELSE
jgi:hypothetical protein